MQTVKFYCIAGYGWSGSTASRDLLKEFSGFDTPGYEYPLLSEPYGLIDLELFLTEHWHVLRHHKAIADFKKFCKKLDNHSYLFNYYGLDLSKRLNIEFLKIVDDLLENLTDYNYEADSRINYYFKNPLVFLFNRIRNKLLTPKFEKMRMSKPNKEDLLSAFCDFNDSVFRNYSKAVPNIILEKAIAVNHLYRSMRYFHNVKVLLVDRDPRDTYADLYNGGGLFGPELRNPNGDSVNNFITWKNRVKESDDKLKTSSLENNILRLRFEDLVNNYDDTRTEIMKFVNVDSEDHVDQFKFFDPSKSGKNIGIWRNFHDQEIMKKIKLSIDYPYND